MSDGVLMQETATCTCGAGPHPTTPGMCAAGHFIHGNQARRTHGAYAFRDRGEASLPPDLRMTVAEFKAQVITDRGGLDELSAIEVARIGHLAEVETMLRLFVAEIVRNGLITKKNRVRSVHGQFLATLDRWQKLAADTGDGRRARQVSNMTAYFAAAIAENEQ